MLLEHIEKHMKATRIPPARFGREAVGDPNFVFNLRDGRQPRGRTATRVLAYIERQARETSR